MLDGLECDQRVPLDFAIAFCECGGGDDAEKCGEDDSDGEGDDCWCGGVPRASVACPIRYSVCPSCVGSSNTGDSLHDAEASLRFRELKGWLEKISWTSSVLLSKSQHLVEVQLRLETYMNCPGHNS